MTRAEQLIARLYRARKEHKESKTEATRMRSKIRSYVFNRDCMRCQARRMLCQEYWDKANKAGAALRAVLREGKKLSEEVES